MRFWRKKSLYVVKRKLVITHFDIDELTSESKTRQSEVDLPDGIYFERTDCQLIFTLVREASQLAKFLPLCRLIYGEIRGSEYGIIDWPKTHRDHFSLYHGLFISSCPQTH